MITIPESIIKSLLQHVDASIRYQTRVHLLGEDPDLAEIKQLSGQIRTSAIVTSLLSGRDPDGTIPLHPYKKWNGAHWVLTNLAELDYPQCDQDLLPMRNQVYDWLASPAHKKHIKVINNRTRRCASQESNALFSSIKLGLINDQTHQLAQDLLKWQWPDGGWNCDKKPAANNSSYFESITPLRALALYAKTFKDEYASQAVTKAAQVFLKRNLFRSRSTGKVIYQEFVELAYPSYWRYNILHALAILDSAGFLADPRCNEALNILEAKQLPDGGFPCERRWYQSTKPDTSGYTNVAWGGVSRRKINARVTLQALITLKHAGRLNE